jgi:triosephosphate isomerase (TIM)
MRKKIVAGNWKMNLNHLEAFELYIKLKKTNFSARVDVMIFPPSVYLSQMNDGAFIVGAQNCYHQNNGAFTGEISAEMLASIGVTHCLVGHSERREYFLETDEDVAKKVDILLKYNITPIVCFGEKLKERENGIHFQVVLEQITRGLFHLPSSEFSKVILSYEPVWAIGTGKTATSSQAQEMHAIVRNFIAENKGVDVANKVRILYGGSCKPSNATELFSCSDVDGGLIGGASLVYDDFVELINIAASIS